MALAVIISLYVSIGLLAAVGSVYLSQTFLPEKYEPVLFGLFLVPIAGFYLAFTAYFEDQAAWGLEATAAFAFTVLGLLGTRVRILLILGYALHGAWDLLHEIHSHLGADPFGRPSTQIPLAYGVFCAAYDWSMAVYFHARHRRWRVAMIGQTHGSARAKAG